MTEKNRTFFPNRKRFGLYWFGADVHKGFTNIASKSGFRHSILHPYPTAETEQKKGQILCRIKTNSLTDKSAIILYQA